MFILPNIYFTKLFILPNFTLQFEKSFRPKKDLMTKNGCGVAGERLDARTDSGSKKSTKGNWMPHTQSKNFLWPYSEVKESRCFKEYWHQDLPELRV